MRLASILAVIGLALGAAPAAAQMDWSDIISTYSMEEAVMDAAREDAPAPTIRRDARSTPRGTPTARGTAPATPTGRMTYTPSPTRRRENMTAFAAQLRSADPDAAAEFERMAGSQDLIAAMTPGLAKAGLSPNNVADAYAAWWVISWNTSRSINADPPPATMRAVSGQVAAVLTNNPDFARASDAERQTMAEGLLLQGALIESTRDQIRDPAQIEQLKHNVRTGARKAGIDLDAVRLTPEGFVPA